MHVPSSSCFVATNKRVIVLSILELGALDPFEPLELRVDMAAALET